MSAARLILVPSGESQLGSPVDQQPAIVLTITILSTIKSWAIPNRKIFTAQRDSQPVIAMPRDGKAERPARGLLTVKRIQKFPEGRKP